MDRRRYRRTRDNRPRGAVDEEAGDDQEAFDDEEAGSRRTDHRCGGAQHDEDTAGHEDGQARLGHTYDAGGRRWRGDGQEGAVLQANGDRADSNRAWGRNADVHGERNRRDAALEAGVIAPVPLS